MALPALQADYLFLGPLIVERLRDQLAVQGLPIAPQDIVRVEDLAQAPGAAGVGGALIFVLWDGEAFVQGDRGQASTSPAQQVSQTWTVVARVRNASQVIDDPHNAVAGRLLSAIHAALAGWVAPGAVRPLQRSQGRRPDYQANDGLYPLSFSVSLHL